ncbi:MAG: putative porin, partial [Sedimentisphaerales bacterium]|nr:putative porin [Sedimentisphaerales bacterium]
SLQKKLDTYETEDQKMTLVFQQKLAELAGKKVETGLPDNLKWIEKIKFSGDFRYRHESIDEEAGGEWKDGHNRNRIRARLMMNAQVNDEWDVGVRIASGSEDPASTNQTLSDGFSSKDLWLDMAYLDYHPEAVKGLHVIGGKMNNPFHNVGKNQLIWDGDLTPEGVAGTYKTALGESTELFANGGGFWIREDKGDDPAQSLWGAQVGLQQALDGVKLTGGVSYYDYGNVQGAGSLNYKGNAMGNIFDNGVYVSDFNIVELFAEMGFSLMDIPMGFYGNFVCNAGAEHTSENQGCMVGYTLNKAKDPGTWQAGYNYRHIEKDAVVGAFNDSDFIGGSTDGRGHQIQFKYIVAKNVETGVSYFLNEKGDDYDDYRRLQVDMVLKF